jgi:hypothetical protein
LALAPTLKAAETEGSGRQFDDRQYGRALANVPGLNRLMKDAGARDFRSRADDLCRGVGYGVAYRTGAPKPTSLRRHEADAGQAQSVTLYPESAAGAYVLKTFERLGIAEAMKAKIKPQPPGQIAGVFGSTRILSGSPARPSVAAREGVRPSRVRLSCVRRW